MPGRIVGDNVIIGANSVVTADIPDNSVAVGVPAKVIRRTNKITKYGILSKDRDAN